MSDEHLKICPECESTLEHKTYKVFHNWICPEGHGSLYPKGELDNILEALMGIDELNLTLWDDRKRIIADPSSLMSPDGPRPLLEIRDPDNPNILVYGDPVTQSLWVHSGEEEKIFDYIQQSMELESVSTYVKIAAKSALELLDDSKPVSTSTGHFLLSMKLLGERIMKAIPFIAF